MPTPLSRERQEPAEVKAYLELFTAGRIPRPRCKCHGCECELIKWGCYWRTDARLADGTVLDPIPIARFRCPEHGTTSWLPPFLNRYLHYVAEVVSQVLDDFAGFRRQELCDGPAECTLGRWVDGLLTPPHRELGPQAPGTGQPRLALLDGTPAFDNQALGLADCGVCPLPGSPRPPGIHSAPLLAFSPARPPVSRIGFEPQLEAYRRLFSLCLRDRASLSPTELALFDQIERGIVRAS